MEKNKSGLHHLPSYDKNNIEDCLYRFKHHILNYIDNIPEIKKNLLYLSIDGKIGNEFMRSFSWKLFLKTLSSDENTTLKTWLEETFNQRKNFKKKVKELLTIRKFKGDPLGGKPVGEGVGWGDYFDKADIKHLIKLDVDRTLQDKDLFCESSIKEIENNILYLFSKGNQSISYKQGMSDILAMLIYSLYPYYTKSNIKKYTPELFDQWVNDPVNNANDIYCFFHDENEFQSDLYYLMENIMKLGLKKFYEDIDEKKNPGETKSYLVKRCEVISDRKLKRYNNQLFYHFIKIGLECGIVLQRWIKCLFTREFDPKDCCIIWDVILANEVLEPSGEFIYADYISIAMINFISDELMGKDQSECFKILFHFPPIENVASLISLTEKLKPSAIKLEKEKQIKEIESKEKDGKTKQQMDENSEQNQKMKKELEQNISMNKENKGNNMNDFLLANQMNLSQNQMMMNNNMLLNPQLFPNMNMTLNKNNNNDDNTNNINNTNKDSKEKETSPLDIIKNSYNANDEEKTSILNEIKAIINKYKNSFNNEDKLKCDFLFQRLEKHM